MDDFKRTLVSVMIPDTCDIQLITGINDYHILHSSLPDSLTISQIHSKMVLPCKQSIQNIHTINYGKDSIDIALTKILLDTTLQTRQMKKGYRLIFKGDSLQEMRLLHMASPNYQSELFPSQKNNSH